MLERELAGLRKEHVDDDTLGRREQDLLDELLPLVVAASAPTSFICAPGSATLKTRVLAVFVK